MLQNLDNLRGLRILSSNLRNAPLLVDSCQSLQKLQIEDNEIQFLPDNYFSGCAKLRIVNLRKNELKTLPSLQSATKTLVSISIDYNRLTKCGLLCAGSFLKLRSLLLDKNYVEDLDVISLARRWPSLVNIQVSGNKLKTLQDLSNSTFGNLAKNPRSQPIVLQAYDNPYMCDKAMSWLAGIQDEIKGLCLFYHIQVCLIIHYNFAYSKRFFGLIFKTDREKI